MIQDMQDKGKARGSNVTRCDKPALPRIWFAQLPVFCMFLLLTTCQNPCKLQLLSFLSPHPVYLLNSCCRDQYQILLAWVSLMDSMRAPGGYRNQCKAWVCIVQLYNAILAMCKFDAQNPPKTEDTFSPPSLVRPFGSIFMYFQHVNSLLVQKWFERCRGTDWSYICQKRQSFESLSFSALSPLIHHFNGHPMCQEERLGSIHPRHAWG